MSVEHANASSSGSGWGSAGQSCPRTPRAGRAVGPGGDELPANTDVARAFDTGIGSAGQAFNSHRPILLQYLITFVRRLKGLDEERRLDVLADAWEFRDWLVGEDDEADGGEQMMRHILLHLLFPVEFERIAS